MPDNTPDMKSKVWKRRAKAVLQLCEDYGLTVGDASNTGNEDISAYFPADSSGAHLSNWENHVGVVVPPEFDFGKWAALTSAGDFSYIYPEYDTKADAIDKATANIGDSIYNEFPACVVNLDTGSRFYPRYDKLTWRKEN